MRIFTVDQSQAADVAGSDVADAVNAYTAQRGALDAQAGQLELFKHQLAGRARDQQLRHRALDLRERELDRTIRADAVKASALMAEQRQLQIETRRRQEASSKLQRRFNAMFQPGVDQETGEEIQPVQDPELMAAMQSAIESGDPDLIAKANVMATEHLAREQVRQQMEPMRADYLETIQGSLVESGGLGILEENLSEKQFNQAMADLGDLQTGSFDSPREMKRAYRRLKLMVDPDAWAAAGEMAQEAYQKGWTEGTAPPAGDPEVGVDMANRVGGTAPQSSAAAPVQQPSQATQGSPEHMTQGHFPGNPNEVFGGAGKRPEQIRNLIQSRTVERRSITESDGEERLALLERAKAIVDEHGSDPQRAAEELSAAGILVDKALMEAIQGYAPPKKQSRQRATGEDSIQQSRRLAP